MITLITYPAGWGEHSLSPFCTKAILLLNASGLPWVRKDTLDPRKYPNQKLPAIDVDGRIIGDSENIRAYLANAGHDMDAHLSPSDRAEALVWQRLSEEHLYYQLVLDRWANPKVWPHVKRDYFGNLPFPVRHILPNILRRNVVAGLTFMGHARQSPEMRMARIEQDLNAIQTRLADQAFLFGNLPCSVDAGLCAVLGAMQATPVDTALKRRVADDARLMSYIDRVKAVTTPSSVAA